MVGTDLYLVVDFGTERYDKVGGVVVEGGCARDVSEEVLAYKFFLGAPNLPSLFVEDGVLVQVNLSLVSTRRRSKEVREESGVNFVVVVAGSRRLYSSGGDGRRVAERQGWAPNDVFGRWGASWEDGGDGRWDVLNFLDEGEVGDDRVEIGSVGGDVGEEVQRFVLKVVEFAARDDEEGVEEEACWRSRDVVIEEWGSQGENVLTWLERLLNGLVGGVDVGLVFKSDVGPAWGSGDGSGSGAVGRVQSKLGPLQGDVDRGGGGDDGNVEEVFLELVEEVGGRSDGSEVERHLVWFKQSAPILGDCSNVANLLLYLSRREVTVAWS